MNYAKYTTLVLRGGALVLAGMLGFAVARETVTTPKQPAPAARVGDYCAAVHIALTMDANDLDMQKIEAVSRFGEQVTFHSEYEIQLCARKPVLLERRPACAIAPDYECLAELAHTAADATKQ